MTAATAKPVAIDLPLRTRTPDGWARLAAQNLGVFLADHAVCEQQAAMSALSLVGKYPDDSDLVDRLSSLAAEEVVHMRRVLALMRRRGDSPPRRRTNRWVGALRARITDQGEPRLKRDRLFVSALIEARSAERFTCLLGVVEDAELRLLLEDLGPAEHRHWHIFHTLATRDLTSDDAAREWDRWLDIEAEVSAGGGIEPTVHG